jgi:hypothetical protein
MFYNYMHTNHHSSFRNIRVYIDIDNHIRLRYISRHFYMVLKNIDRLQKMLLFKIEHSRYSWYNFCIALMHVIILSVETLKNQNEHHIRMSKNANYNHV